MALDKLEAERRNSLKFQTAQHIVALLQEVDTNDVEATLKLVKEIRQSETERAIAVFSYRRK